MSDEVEKAQPEELSAEVIERIQALYQGFVDSIEDLPEGMVETRRIMHFYAVHTDEDGQALPEQDPVNVEFLKAIVALETRIMMIERRLGIS